jgi:hypothetical protein
MRITAPQCQQMNMGCNAAPSCCSTSARPAPELGTVADAVESGGQHMQQEAAHELERTAPDYALLEQSFPIKCYFATPYHSWERGGNENFNGLLRQYLPNGICMRHVTQVECDYIARELNNRPRKRHGFKTPEELAAS